MFSGIIRHQGILSGRDLRHGHLWIFAPRLVRWLRTGDSIAVDGVCLTVTRRRRGGFGVDVTPETVRRTNFRWSRLGWNLNLELPLRMSDRLHGHVVLGHVDGVGRVIRGGSVLTVQIPARLMPYMAEKGSVTLNGVSLTIARCRGTLVRIALIPETLRRTNLRFLKTGSQVNVEVDVLARYTLGKVRQQGMRQRWKASVHRLKKR